MNIRKAIRPFVKILLRKSHSVEVIYVNELIKPPTACIYLILNTVVGIVGAVVGVISIIVTVISIRQTCKKDKHQKSNRSDQS